MAEVTGDISNFSHSLGIGSEEFAHLGSTPVSRERSAFLEDLPLDERFRVLSKNAPENGCLPRYLPEIVTGPHDMKRLFDTAWEYWEHMYNPAAVKASLEILKETQNGKHADLKSLLKSTRKPGLIALSSFLLFDKGHLAPADHWRVVKRLGEVSDYVGSPDLPRVAQKLEKSIERYDHITTKSSFTPDSKAGFQAYLTHTLDDMKRIALTAQPQEVELLHYLRKNGTRVLMNLFQLATIASPTDEFTGTYFHLKALDHEIGSSHDEVVEAQVNTNETHHEVAMELSGDLREKVVATTDYLRTQWKLPEYSPEG